MKELKFRVWCKSYQRMLSNEHLTNATKGMVNIANADLKKRKIPINKPAPYGIFLPLEDDDLIFMQYIGQKDCLGQEIYEDDIVSLDNEDGVYGIIKWDDSSSNFYIATEFDEYYTFDSVYSYELTVLGNIYENTELFKGETK